MVNLGVQISAYQSDKWSHKKFSLRVLGPVPRARPLGGVLKQVLGDKDTLIYTTEQL